MNQINSYAGIGSRDTPSDILQRMIGVGAFMAQQKWQLRSGAAQGADQAFEHGCDMFKGAKQIFLPWKGFSGHTGQVYPLPTRAYDIAAHFHPAWDRCKPSVMTLMARNVQQVGGPNLDNPSKFVICWTPKGELVGGTSLAIRIALSQKIPVLNFGNMSLNQIEESINQIMDKTK